MGVAGGGGREPPLTHKLVHEAVDWPVGVVAVLGEPQREAVPEQPLALPTHSKP
jgi:hypothetical protein